MKKLELIVYTSMDMLRSTIIGNCQKKNHVQQVAYSTYHDSLTQVCFTCMRVRTTIKNEDIRKEAELIEEESLNREDELEGIEHIDSGLFPDDEALADFLIMKSQELQSDVACYQEAYKRIFRKHVPQESY